MLKALRVSGRPTSIFGLTSPYPVAPKVWMVRCHGRQVGVQRSPPRRRLSWHSPIEADSCSDSHGCRDCVAEPGVSGFGWIGTSAPLPDSSGCGYARSCAVFSVYSSMFSSDDRMWTTFCRASAGRLILVRVSSSQVVFLLP